MFSANLFIMQNSFTKIRPLKEYRYTFCICTIVTDFEEYALMQQSFQQAGFNDGCAYMVADNSSGNVLDAYEAIRRFLQDSEAAYTIIVHQDVRCEDSMDTLKDCLTRLEKQDKNWAVCGNAGASDYKKMAYYLNDAGNIRKTEGLPKQVHSLDENLLIIKTAAHLSLSADIRDFHFYGTDLCIVADLLGYSAYVIPFMVTHLSKGNLGDLEQKKPAFLEKYGHKLRSRFVQTSCTNFYLDKSPSKNKFMNSRFVFFWIKAKTRLQDKFRK